MSKPHLILWGGSWLPLEKPLGLDDLNSHATVSYFFLKQALEKLFDVTGVDEFDHVTQIEPRPDTLGVLSTFQAGFTQLASKKPEMYEQVAPRLKGKMFSIIDETTWRRTKEDILFTVIPPTSIKNRAHNLVSPSSAVHMGWCASPQYCHPENKEGRPFTIFIDHGHYAGEDFTHHVVEAANTLPDDNIRILIQTNAGVIEWEKGRPWSEDQFDRASQVPWETMMSYYRQCDLFCLTHKESAGLGAIEAAMCGARLIIPEHNGPFLHPSLLQEWLDYERVLCHPNAVNAAMTRALEQGVKRGENHERTAQHAAWDVAAQNIYNALVKA